jgi:hypothetical protein
LLETFGRGLLLPLSQRMEPSRRYSYQLSP